MIISDPLFAAPAHCLTQQFILRVKRKNEKEFFIGRRYGDFSRLHRGLRTELPGKVLPVMPKKNKQSSTATNLISAAMGRDEDASSISSVSTTGTGALDGSIKNLSVQGTVPEQFSLNSCVLIYFEDHRRTLSTSSPGRGSPRPSMETSGDGKLLPNPDGEV